LARVRQQIEVERDSKSKVIRAERALAESRYSLLQRFSQDLVQAAGRTDVGETASRAEQLGVTLPPSKYVAIGFFAAPGSGELGFTRLEELVSQVADSVLLPISDTLDLMLYWGYHTMTQAAKELGQLFDAVASPASAAAECRTISLADGFVNIAELSLAFERLKQLAAGAFYLRCGSILTEVPHFAETEAWDLFLPVRGDLRTALNTRDSEIAKSIIEALFDEFDQVRPAPEGVRGVIESILIDIGFVANDAKVKFPIDFRSFPRLDHHRAHLLETVRAFFAAVEANAAHSPRSDIEKIKAYIDNHLAEPIGLDTICELVFMNKSYLSRLFKQEVGETFSEYLMRRRVEKAKRLLQSSERSIDEITEAIGLENVNHFYRIFKKVTGTTPGAFRK
ncbi:MAG: helix-turn-helix transcriptional regulator, partial [Spirochaetales bacterium]